jgi:hypothetical protein
MSTASHKLEREYEVEFAITMNGRTQVVRARLMKRGQQ